MRILSTFCFLFFATSCFAQTPDNSVVIRGRTSIGTLCFPGSVDTVVSNCWGNSMVDRASGTISRLQVKDTVKPTSNRTSETRIRLRCGRILNEHTDPLLIVDGIVTEFKNFSSINANEIEKIHMLKSAEGIAIFGPDAANGVIAITLKLKYKQFVVIDSADNKPIAYGTVGITMKNGDNTLFYVADDKGSISSNSPKEFDGLKLSVSAVGYKTATRYYNGDISTTDTIRLKRNIVSCETVVVTSPNCPRKIVCYGSARGIRGKAEKKIADENASLSFYPNPVPKGGSFTVLFSSTGAQAIRLVGLDGREMMRQLIGGKNSLQVQTDPRWTPGVYFVQLVYENRRLGASAKMIIQ